MKFIHLADAHLGLDYSESGFDKGFAGLKTESVFDNLQSILSFCNEEAVDLVLIAGDLIEAEQVTKNQLQRLSQMLADLETAKVVIVAGNHDPLDYGKSGRPGIYQQVVWPNQVHIMPVEMTDLILPELDVTVYGASFAGPTAGPVDWTALRQLVESKRSMTTHHLLLLHGDTEGESDYRPLKVSQMERCAFDYVALGHIHQPKKLTERIVYAGSLEPLNFKETDQPHGAVFGELERHHLQIEWLISQQLPFVKRRLVIRQSLGQAELEEQINGYLADLSKAAVELTVTGANQPFLQGVEERLIELANRQVYLKIKEQRDVERQPSNNPPSTDEQLYRQLFSQTELTDSLWQQALTEGSQLLADRLSCLNGLEKLSGKNVKRGQGQGATGSGIRIERLEIIHFGQLQNRQIDLTDGFNLIVGNNETGKSTLVAFVVAMFYGFYRPKVKSRLYLESLNQYKPWQGGDYRGRLLFFDEAKGQSCWIERSFNRKQEQVEVYEADSGRRLTDRYPLHPVQRIPDIGGYHFGMERDEFHYLVVISQGHQQDYQDVLDQFELADWSGQSLPKQEITDLMAELTEKERALGSTHRQTTIIGEKEVTYRQLLAKRQAIKAEKATLAEYDSLSVEEVNAQANLTAERLTAGHRRKKRVIVVSIGMAIFLLVMSCLGLTVKSVGWLLPTVFCCLIVLAGVTLVGVSWFGWRWWRRGELVFELEQLAKQTEWLTAQVRRGEQLNQKWQHLEEDVDTCYQELVEAKRQRQVYRYSLIKLEALLSEKRRLGRQRVSQLLTESLAQSLDGRYRTPELPLDGFIEKEGQLQSVRLNQLSYGTQDMVAILFRLAILNTYFEGRRLPMIFDDSFNHIDDERLQKLLIELQTANRQVIYLTCHHREEDLTGCQPIELKTV